MVRYLIVRCPHCGNVCAVQIGYRTRQCPYCGTRFEVVRAQVIARASSGKEAREIIQKLKSGTGPRPIFQRFEKEN